MLWRVRDIYVLDRRICDYILLNLTFILFPLNYIQFIRYWGDLDEDQRQAATALGYDQESWDKEEGMMAKCCVIQ